MNSKEIKSGLKTATLMNNNTMNNEYRTCTLDSPIQYNSSETPHMRSSTPPNEIKCDLKTANLMNNKTMNSKEINNGLNGSNLMNNITMDNHTRTYILDEPVPDIGVETLHPTPLEDAYKV